MPPTWDLTGSPRPSVAAPRRPGLSGGGFAMKKLCLAMVATAIVAVSVSVIAAAGARNAASFAVGSAKVDAFVGAEHLAFSAHNGALFPGTQDCSATGHANYTNSLSGLS